MKRLLDRLRFGPAHGSPALRWAVLLASAVVGAVFIRAALPKIQDPGAFALLVYQYQAIPELWVNPVALFLPWLELICGVALIAIPWGRRAAALLILLMLIGFTGLMVSVIARGIELSCGCFSVNPEDAQIGWTNVARNAALLAATALALYGAARPRAKDDHAGLPTLDDSET